MKLTSTDAEELNYVQALVYGETGIGKTTSLKTLVPDRTTIALCERGTRPLQDMKFPVFHLESWDDVQGLYRMFAHPDAIEDPKWKAIVDRTKVLVVDSLSDVGGLCWQQILKVDRPAMLDERSKSGKADKDSPLGIYAEAATQEDWGVYGTRMMNLIGAFCHLPLHIIFTCGLDEKKNKAGHLLGEFPDLGGRSARKCGSRFGVVLLMKVGKDQDGNDTRVWQTHHDGYSIAKDEGGKLDPEEPADWVKLFRKLLPKKTDNGSAKK